MGIKKGAGFGSLWVICLFSAIAVKGYYLVVSFFYCLTAFGVHLVVTKLSGGVSLSLPMITSN